MQANTNRISDRRVWIATLISAAGWGLSWFISLTVLFGAYFDRDLPIQGAIVYYLSFGFIGITTSIIGLWIVRVRLPITHIIILYAAWGIAAIGLGILLYNDLPNESNNLINLLLGPVSIFGVTIGWILVQSVSGLSWQDGLKMAMGWILSIGLPLLAIFFAKDLYYWLLITPLVIFVTCILGGRVTFWHIQRAQNDMPEATLGEPAALGQLMQSSAQQTTFEVVHDDGKPKVKRKPKPALWSSIPFLRIYAAVLTIVVLIAIGMFTIITPVHEIRIPILGTPNPTNSTPGPQWGNRLPPTNPRWPWNSTVMTNTLIGDIPPNTIVTLGQSFYDFGVEMWWYKAKTSDGYTTNAWESQISLTLVPLQATGTSFVSTSGELTTQAAATPTPLSGLVILGEKGGYHLIALAFDGGTWTYTLEAHDGNTFNVNASQVSPDIANAPTPTAPFMDKVGTMRTDLVTRETIGAIPSGSSVQLIKIIWYEGKAPVYLITPNVTGSQIPVGEASADQLDNAS